MAVRTDKIKRNIAELKDFARIAYSLAELRHLVEVPFAGHMMADVILYLDQKMIKEGNLPNTADEDRQDGTLPFRNYPKTEDPDFDKRFRAHVERCGPQIPHYMLTGPGKARQIRDCFPPFVSVLERIEGDFAEIGKWLDAHPKYGTRMKEALKSAEGSLFLAKELKRACKFPPLSGKDRYDTMQTAMKRTAEAVSDLVNLASLFNAKAERLINSLPDAESEVAYRSWMKDTNVALRPNLKVPFHLVTAFGHEIDDSPATDVSKKREEGKVSDGEPLTAEEELLEAKKGFKALGELRFLLISPMAAHSGLDFLIVGAPFWDVLFEKDAPKEAPRKLRAVLPSFNDLHAMAMERIEKAMDWLARYPSWTMANNTGLTCLDTLKTIKDAVVKAEAQRRWADDIENGLMVQWRPRLKDTAFINLDDSANAINDLFISFVGPLNKILDRIPVQRREKAKWDLLNAGVPKFKPNEKMPPYVKKQWRVELISTNQEDSVKEE